MLSECAPLIRLDGIVHNNSREGRCFRFDHKHVVLQEVLLDMLANNSLAVKRSNHEIEDAIRLVLDSRNALRSSKRHQSTAFLNLLEIHPRWRNLIVLWLVCRATGRRLVRKRLSEALVVLKLSDIQPGDVPTEQERWSNAYFEFDTGSDSDEAESDGDKDEDTNKTIKNSHKFQNEHDGHDDHENSDDEKDNEDERDDDQDDDATLSEDNNDDTEKTI